MKSGLKVMMRAGALPRHPARFLKKAAKNFYFSAKQQKVRIPTSSGNPHLFFFHQSSSSASAPLTVSASSHSLLGRQSSRPSI